MVILIAGKQVLTTEANHVTKNRYGLGSADGGL
jgi:hypothetical protein